MAGFENVAKIEHYPPYAAPHNDEKALQPLPVINPAEWYGIDAPEREWALEGFIPLRQATLLTGAGSAGKSLVTQQLATCIAWATPFMGIDVIPRPTFYITCEDDADELHRRQKAICSGLGIPLEHLGGKLHLVSLCGETDTQLATFDDKRTLHVAPLFERIQAAVAGHPGAFIVLDNVAHLLSDEISRSAVAGFMSLLNRLALEIDGSVLLLGHPNKAGEQFSGSTAFENQVRSRLFMEIPKDGDGFAADPDLRTLSVAKANYGRNGESLSFRWYRGAFLRDEDLPANVRDTIVEHVAAGAENEAFLACLRTRNAQEGRTVGSSPGPNYAPSQFEGMPEAKGFKKRTLKAAMERLFTAGRIASVPIENRKSGRTAYVIREVEEGSHNAPHNARTTLSHNADNSDAQQGTTHSYIINNIPGAPHGVAAPDDEPEEGRTMRRPVFPAPEGGR